MTLVSRAAELADANSRRVVLASANENAKVGAGRRRRAVRSGASRSRLLASAVAGWCLSSFAVVTLLLQVNSDMLGGIDAIVSVLALVAQTTIITRFVLSALDGAEPRASRLPQFRTSVSFTALAEQPSARPADNLDRHFGHLPEPDACVVSVGNMTGRKYQVMSDGSVLIDTLLGPRRFETLLDAQEFVVGKTEDAA